MSRLSESFKIGGLDIAALSDGAPDRELSGFFSGVDPAEWTKALGISDPSDPVPFNFGSFLIRGDGHTTLVDTGFGPRAAEMDMGTGGELMARLDDLGVNVGEIDRVVLTHLHFDHCGGNVDSDGKPAFPNASYYVSEAELSFWTSDEPADAEWVKIAGDAIGPPQEAGLVETFSGEHAISDAITMIPTPGHTPGHCSLLLTSQGEHLVIAGDAAHHPVHFEHHDWIPGVDLDPAESTRSRGRLSALAVEKDATVTGGHFPILTLGKLRRVEGGYRWEDV